MVTGDVHHEQAYQDVVAVRNGSKPRADGRSVSLQILMKQAGFTDAEFAKLKQAEDLSNELAKIETVAMNLGQWTLNAARCSKPAGVGR